MKIYSINKNLNICKTQNSNRNAVYRPTFKSCDLVNKSLVVSIPRTTAEMVLSNNQKKIRKFTQVNRDALERILGKFKHDFSFSDIDYFLQNDRKPDCVKLEELLVRIKNEGIFTFYLDKLLHIGKDDMDSDTNFDKINKFLDFRISAIEKRSLLDKYNAPATLMDVDEIIFRNILATTKTLGLLGEKAFIFSFKEKKDNVQAFIKDIGNIDWDEEIYDGLIKLTNPTSTARYVFLEESIARLKATFPKIKDSVQLEELKKLINTLTREKRELLENSIKDPKEILEKTLIISALNKNGMCEEAKELLAVLNPKTENDKRLYNETLNRILFGFYGVEKLDDSILEKLNFQNSKYLPRLFYTKQDFKTIFKELIDLLINNPEKTNLEIFNELSKNIQTRLEFEKYGLDYNKWVKYNPDSQIEYILDENNKIVVKKVDMNNVPKALFLGDEADCCTRVNGVHAKSAVSYITSKMIQAIEVYHNNLPVANTMCYLAKVNNKLALILDNIEVKPQYRKDEMIKKSYI